MNKICKNCSQSFEDQNRKDRVFCSSSCSATYNNKYRIRKDAKVIHDCKNCGKPNKNKIYCSNKCFGEYKSKLTYENFKNGLINSYSNLYSPKSFKKFILIEQKYRCAICKNLNIWEGKELIFILDHIDGNAENNTRENLRLVCPNCDTQLPTFKSKNKIGRSYRRNRYKNGKSY